MRLIISFVLEVLFCITSCLQMAKVSIESSTENYKTVSSFYSFTYVGDKDYFPEIRKDSKIKHCFSNPSLLFFVIKEH